MMRFNDALRFAKLKIKQHKVRNALSIIAAALGLIIMLVIMFGSSGVTSVGKKIFQDSLSNRFFTVTSIFGGVADLNAIAAEGVGEGAIASFKSYESVRAFELGGMPTQNEYDYGIRLRTADEVFVQDFLFEGQSFAKRDDGVIPVVLPKEWLVNRVEGQDKIVEMSQRELYELGLRMKSEYSAKEVLLQERSMTFELKAGDEAEEIAADTGITVRVVGFSPGGFFDNMGLSGVMVVPDWAMDDERVAELFAAESLENMNSYVLHEFSSAEARNAYFEKANEERSTIGGDSVSSFTMPLMPRYDFFTAFVKIARGVGLGIGGFLLFIALLFILINVSKAVADSRKEIGVFRAVGATKWDIQKIYFAFAGIVVNIGFIIAVIVAMIVNGLVSLKWGDDLFYRLMNMGTVVDVPKPAFLFVHIGPSILILYVIVFVLALLAAAIPASRASKIDPVIALKD